MSDTADTPERPPWYGTARPSGPNGNHVPGGRFAKGNKAGSGNPMAKEIHVRRMKLWEWTSEDERGEVWEGIKAGAKAGNKADRELFCAYYFGKPLMEVDVSATMNAAAQDDVRDLRHRLKGYAEKLPLNQRYELAAFLAESEGKVIELEEKTSGPDDRDDLPV